MKKILAITLFVCILLFTGCKKEEMLAKKPVICLYPAQETEVSVKISLDGELTCTYPDYNDGWNVTAKPDGTLINHADNKQYSYLYWEGNTNKSFDMSKGFVVKASETIEFLQKKLAFLGLTPKEYNEFIVYWLPILQENEYNLITFQGKEYTDTAKLDITPTPDSVLRVFMAYKPLKKPIEIEKQEIQSFQRKGFTVVEWGGGEVQ